MKSRIIDNAEDRINQMRGKIKKFVGNIFKNRDLETEGKEQTSDGKMQEKVGEGDKGERKQP